MEKILTKIKYPKMLLLLICIVISYALFQAHFFKELIFSLNHHGYVAAFLGGLLFAFGFTAPLAVGLFIELSSVINPFWGALIAGFGSLISDFAIFKFIKISFRDEFELLKLHWFIQKVKFHFENKFSEKVREYLLWTFAGILIASPLPDEFGVTVLGGMTNINQRTFAVISFSLNTVGVFVILGISKIL